MNSAGNAAGNAAGALALGLLATVAVSGGAQSAQLFGPAISGNPVMTVPFADLAPGSVIFSEHITDPTVITTTTGGGASPRVACSLPKAWRGRTPSAAGTASVA